MPDWVYILKQRLEYLWIDIYYPVKDWWEDLTYRPDPPEYPDDWPMPEEKVLPIQKD